MMRVGKYIGWFLLLIVLMCLLVLGAIYLLAGTDRGFATLADLLDRRVAGLNINDVTGNLGKGISANRFDYTSETLSVEGQGLSSTWRAGCLLKRQACLDEVTIDRLDIVNLASQDGTDTDNKSESILLPQVNLPVGFTIDKALIKQLSYRPSKDSKPYIIDNIHLSAQSRENTVEINDASLGYENFTVTMNGNIELADDYPLVLAIDIDTTDLLPDTLDGGQGNQAQLVKIRFSDTLSDLTVNAQLAGTVNASLTAVAKPLDRLLPLTATIKSDSISWPLTGERMFSARDLRIELDGDMNDYRVSANSQIDGREIPPGAVEIHGKINTERVDVEKFALDSPGGNALGSATVTLNDTLKWNTNFSLSDIDPSVKWAAYPGSLDATIDASGLLRDGRWSLNLEQMTIVGDLQSYPLELSAKMAKGLNDVWFIDHMRLNNLDNQIEVAGVVEDHWDLKGNIDLPALQHLMPGLQGSLSSQISINGPLQEPDIQVSASTPQITYENSHIDELSFNADIRQLFVDDSAVKLTIESGNLEGQELDGMDFSLSGQRDDHKLSLTAGGPMETALALELTGVLDKQLNWTGIVEKNTSLSAPDHQLILSNATEIGRNHESGRFNIDPHCWSSDQASLCLENQVVLDKAGQAQITLEQYSLERLDSLLPDTTRLTGMLAASAELLWGDDVEGGKQALVSAVVDQGGIQAQDAANNPVRFDYQLLTSNARLQESSVDAELSLSSETLGTADLAVVLDRSNAETPMQGRIQLDGLQLSLLQPLFPELDQLSGTISANGSLGGSLALPSFDGTVRLEQPKVSGQSLPVPITGGQIEARFSGQTLRLDGELLSDNGTVGVEGVGSIKAESWDTNVRLSGRNLQVRSDPIQDSLVNHDIDISVNAKRVSIKGNIDIPMAVIDVEELPEGATTVSSDVVIVEDENEPVEPESAKQSGALNITTALNLRLGDDVKVSAYGLNARLEGDMDVLLRGQNPPQLGGEIKVVNGIYKQYGQDLNASGQILFVGPANNTRLSIDAVREIEAEDRVAGLRIQGTAADPEIILFTEPSDKSQDAILSYIVLGRDINEASDQDANLLAAAALAVTVKGGRNLAGGIASALGVEDFALETQGAGDDTELVVSGRLNDRLLLRYGRGVFGAQNTLYLRYDLTQKLYLEAAQGAEQAVDLFYSFSF